MKKHTYTIFHELDIKAPVSKVYSAITTRRGLRSWWTVDSEIESRIGSIGMFGFYQRATVFKFRITRLLPKEEVVWHYIGNGSDWQGTKIIFKLHKMSDSKITAVKFWHEGWKGMNGSFGSVNYTWGQVLSRLKKYCETNKPNPYFRS